MGPMADGEGREDDQAEEALLYGEIGEESRKEKWLKSFLS
jgi:hypothetical protein